MDIEGEFRHPLLQGGGEVLARLLVVLGRETGARLVEQGLRHVIAGKKANRPFKLRDASFKGKGLTPEFADADWQKFREAIYEGRGE